MDYITNLNIGEDEIFIKTKEYKLSYAPETKNYLLKAELYDKGAIFTGNYLVAKAQSEAYIHQTGESLWEKIFG